MAKGKHQSGPVDGDISWNQWVKKRKEEFEKRKEAAAAEQPVVPVENEVEEEVAASSKQLSRKRKERSEKKEKASAAEQPVVPIESEVEEEVDVARRPHKKKKEMRNMRCGDVNPVEVKKLKNSADKRQTENKNVDQEENSPEKQTSVSSQERSSPMRRIVPKSVLATVKTREVKAFLASQGISFKEWKQKKKEEYRRWKEIREARKLQRLEKNKTENYEELKKEVVGESQVCTVSTALPGLLLDNTQSPELKNRTENCEEEKKEVVGKGKAYTVSIALPGSILDNAQSPELKTYLAGQIARAAAVFNVNEVVVFEETGNGSALPMDPDAPLKLREKHGCTQLVKVLQFLECPQYLRKYFFPMQKDLAYAGVLNPLDMPHHLRVDDVSPYREGVTLGKPVKSGKGSFVYIGYQKSCVIDKAIEPHVRVTVKLDEKSRSKKHYTGLVVSPSTPYKQDGIYWGYSVRLAESLGAVFSQCPYKEGYDHIIGTSDKGSDVDQCIMPSFKHLLIVFGGLKGLEASLEADEILTVNDPNFLFHHYLNTCPSQGARTIRTEEAILITLSALRPKILQCQSSSL